MSKFVGYVTYVAFLLGTLAVSIVLSQEEQVVTRDAFSFTVPNPLGEKPLFQTNHQDGRFFSLHIPMVYDGVMHFRGPGLMGTKLVMDWFHGLCSFTYDKTPQADGNLHGPVKMELLWMTVFNNEQSYLRFKYQMD